MSIKAPKALAPKLAQAQTDLRKEVEDKRCLRGKHAPPEGVCKVCSGRVIAEVRFPSSNLIGGPPPNAYVAHWYCDDCGIMYRTPPKEEKEKKEKKDAPQT